MGRWAIWPGKVCLYQFSSASHDHVVSNDGKATLTEHIRESISHDTEVCFWIGLPLLSQFYAALSHDSV